ncbi:MAG TPA: Ig-like domain-containing protein [Ferruginibacter sp.]|nr:Ig-like domain-containing protein [Ferruginibacter sp.]HMP21843.1 Ig-like domain-containing protein [Ferruginibacter sp.]
MKAILGHILKCTKAALVILLPVVCCLIFTIAPVNGQTVTKQLYLSDPSQALDRTDPVATADATTAQTAPMAATAQYLYAFRGNSRIDFWRYNIAANSWSSMANAPGTVTRGAALTTNGSFIYAFRGGTTDFWRYNPSLNTWSSMAAAPAAVSAGAALVHANGAIYAFRGGNNSTFWKYTISTNTWTTLAETPSSSGVNWGGALTTDGTDIYALRGTGSSVFWKYNIASNTWSVMAALPMAIDAGGSLGFDGVNIFALRGGGFNSFYRYNISTNSWTTLNNTPSTVFRGGSLVSDDQFSYAIRGNNNNNFWRYNGSSWSSMANTPSAVDSGGAIVKFGTTAKTETFTQAPALCSPLTIKAGNITVVNHISMVYGTLPATPNITATLQYGATTIITLSNPVYNSVAGTLTWTGNLASDMTIPAAQTITLTLSTQQPGVSFRIEYDSQTKPSRVVFPVSTFINVNSVEVFNAAYPAGMAVSNVLGGSTRYIRTTVTDPFGFADITSASVTVTPPGTNMAATAVAGAGCTRVFQNTWNVPAGAGTYTINATAKEGYENTVTHSRSTVISTCTSCPPTANIDYATGDGGVPLEIDVLANDSDPNNDINPASLKLTVEPKNGQVIIDDNKLLYLPNGTFEGNDTLTYQVCDLTAPTPQCATAQVIVTILPLAFDACEEASKDKIYYIPYAENEVMTALKRSASVSLPTNNVRTIISIKVSYPGMKLIWDHWEDGYETNILGPTQSTTEVWGDGNIYNGVAPGYPTDIIPAGGSIVLDNTMPTPRVAANRFYDGKDKLYSSGQISVTQVSGEPSNIAVQCMKTNVAAYPSEFGKSFTIPVGQDLPSRDFRYTALFIRAAEDNTEVEIDRDNNGSFNTKFILNQGEVMLVDEHTAPSGNPIMAGAVVTSNKPIGVDAHFAGVDNFSSREVPIFPATWYSHTYYTPVPTTGPATAPHDTAVVMLYNSLNRDITINWESGVPSSGSILLKSKVPYRFVMPLSANAAYKFTNPTRESFVALEIYDSYTPGGGGNDGATRDWAFNLISEGRLTDFASVAWAPGSTDMTRNDNPIWVTPSANTTVYVKYDGDVLNGPSTSPCGLKYDAAIPVNYLKYIKIKDASDNDQSGTAVYTCNGAKLAAVYGQDAATALTANPSWDVGSTIQPFCKEKLLFANNDYAVTLINTPVNIDILKNDFGFQSIIDPSTVTMAGVLQPTHGTVTINKNGSIIYIPNTGYVGNDTFQYTVCSTPTPIVCGTATVFVSISSCPSPGGQNMITGQVFLDKNQDAVKNDGGSGFSPAKIYLYTDGNCNGTATADELTDSAFVDINGLYQFIKSPEKIVADNFDDGAGGRTCADGSDGNTPWRSNWYDGGDASTGFCVSPAQTEANTDVEIVQDGAWGYALRLDDASKSATREFNMQNATQAFLSFSYRKATTTLTTGENIFVQLSANGSTYNTIFTIPGNGTSNASYIPVYNLPIPVGTYNTNNRTYLRFTTSSNADEGDFVFIDNVSIKFLQYDQCYIVTMNPASLPSTAYPTGTLSRSINFNNAATCATNIDFGVKRITTHSINDENSTWQNMAVNGVVMHNDFDQENNAQSFGSFLHPSTMATIASGATVSGINKAGTAIANAGTLTFNATGNYTFSPVASFTGVVHIPYRLCDNGTPAACDTATLSITVDPLPSAGSSVIANNDEDISYGNAISGNLLHNDRDPKNLPFTVTLFTYDTNSDGIPDITTIPGTVTVSGIDIYGKAVANAGTLYIAASGDYTFTPTAGFAGSVYASYTISNSAGATATAKLNFDILEDVNGLQNDPPFAGDDFGYTNINQPVTGSFISNDREPNDDVVTLNGTTINTDGPATAIGTPIATTKGGTIQFFANGNYTYTPPVGYIGPDYVTYTICDVTSTMPQPLCASAIIHFLTAPGISISGKVWDDADGNVIKAVSEPVTNAGNTLFVNLVSELGYVITSVPVAADGTYSFSNITPGDNYSLVLSTTQGSAGSLSPAATLPEGWVHTGETRNGVIDYGAVGIIDNREYGYTNVVNFDFGIEQLPNTDNYDTRIDAPIVGQKIILNGGANPPVLSGSDPEDCPTGCVLSGRRVHIDEVPMNANLLYNGVLVSSGQTINNFNPALLAVEITPVTVGTTGTYFIYSFVDAAGKKDPTPGLYALNWYTVLPATGLTLTAVRNGSSIALNWKTISEINSDYFEIERSTDGRNYTKIGTAVKASGRSDAEKQYQGADDTRELENALVVYYRIKLKDINGKLAYSNVAPVKLPPNGNIKVTPNPFVSQITVSVSSEHASTVAVRLMDMSGRTVLSSIQKVSKDAPQFTIRDLGNLTRGIYVIEVTDTATGKKQVVKLEKSN